jgi:hypothetical protein
VGAALRRGVYAQLNERARSARSTKDNSAVSKCNWYQAMWEALIIQDDSMKRVIAGTLVSFSGFRKSLKTSVEQMRRGETLSFEEVFEDAPSPGWHADVLRYREHRVLKGWSQFQDWPDAKCKIRARTR